MSTILEPDFETEVEPYRRELIAHCYRLLGSTQEAITLSREVLVRATHSWQQRDVHRQPVRDWLYQLTTLACLGALEERGCRSLPSGLHPASHDPTDPAAPTEFEDADLWLQPFPDALLDPVDRAAQQHNVRLELISGLQLLPARQRAMIVLRHIVRLNSAKVATLLGSSTFEVDAALRRATDSLATRDVVVSDPPSPHDSRAYRLVDRYLRAFEAADTEGLDELLDDNVVLEMPPVARWYRGRRDTTRYLRRLFEAHGDTWRLLPTSANGHPALATYRYHEKQGNYRPYSLQILTVTNTRVTRNVMFADPEVLTFFDFPNAL